MQKTWEATIRLPSGRREKQFVQATNQANAKELFEILYGENRVDTSPRPVKAGV